MAKRDNHYDVAFEAYLRERQISYVAVDEARRSPGGNDATAGQTLKSLDFIVSPRETAVSWLVDVKGRHFPAGRRKQYWRNWTTADELHSLARWESLFGRQFAALLVFAYLVLDDVSPLPSEQLFSFRDRLYAFVGIRPHHYLSLGRVISPKWNTIAVPGSQFRQLARPVHELFATAPSAANATSAANESAA
jgi:hypothetical protein